MNFEWQQLKYFRVAEYTYKFIKPRTSPSELREKPSSVCPPTTALYPPPPLFVLYLVWGASGFPGSALSARLVHPLSLGFWVTTRTGGRSTTVLVWLAFLVFLVVIALPHGRTTMGVLLPARGLARRRICVPCVRRMMLVEYIQNSLPRSLILGSFRQKRP